jgi:hypothetical protein
MKSPLRVFFFMAFALIAAGVLLDWGGSRVDFYGLRNVPPVEELNLARFYWSSGQIEAALEEYHSVAQNGSPVARSAARTDMSRLVAYESYYLSKLNKYLAYASWAYPPSTLGLK